MNKQHVENDISTLDRLIEQYEGEILEARAELDILRYKLENAEDAKRKILDLLAAEQVACSPPVGS